MADSELRIRYVLVDDIDFTPLGVSVRAMMKPTQDVRAMIEEVRNVNPELLKYGIARFQVVKILQPVPQETITPGQDSETLKRRGRGSLQPILAQFRERSKAAKRTELANDYVHILSDQDKLQDCFQHKDEALISAVVVRLTTREEKSERHRLERHLELPMVKEMGFRRRNLQLIVYGSPPSDASGQHGFHLRQYALMDRPEDRYTFPVALFDKNLALLQYKFDNLNVAFNSNKSQLLFSNEVDFYKDADRFISAAIAEHTSEGQRMAASRPFLEAIFGKDLELEYKVARIGRSELLSAGARTSNTKFDGAYVTKIEADGSSMSTVVFELKTKPKADPIAQLTKGYAEEVYGFKNKDYFDSSHFPKIFIALNGHKLEIAIAICLETVVVNEILSLDMRDNFSRSELRQKVARVAVALKDCFAQLNTYYSELTVGPPLSFFPSPTLEPVDTFLPLTRGAFDAVPDTRTVSGPNSANQSTASSVFRSLKIVSRLGSNNVEMTQNDQPDSKLMRHNLFLAKWHDHADNEPELVVKLATRYGPAAHRCLAEQALAPELYLCQPVIGGFIVVVMGRAKGTSLHLYPDLNKGTVLDQLKEVLTALKGRQLVHGDLRAPNIIVDAGSKIKVIDFDWAAKEDEGFYPSKINKEELSKEWHDDVEPMTKMKMEHDHFAVFKVLGPNHLGLPK